MTRGLRTAVAGGALLLSLGGAVLAEQQSVKELRKYIGQDQQVCGTVTTFQVIGKDGSGDCALKLDFGSADRPKFYISVQTAPGSELRASDGLQYVSDDVCATGRLDEDRKHVLNISIRTPKQIEITASRNASRFADGAHLLCEAGIATPKPLREVKATYTAELMRERAEDSVLMAVVVGPDGAVTDARPIRGRYPEMNDQAMKAIQQWHFAPGTLRGAPVAVVVFVDETFVLR